MQHNLHVHVRLSPAFVRFVNQIHITTIAFLILIMISLMFICIYRYVTGEITTISVFELTAFTLHYFFKSTAILTPLNK